MPITSMKGSKPLLSMTPVTDWTDRIGALTGSPVSTTWYEATNYSGMGRICGIAIYGVTTNTAELRVTTDGNADTIDKTTLQSAGTTAGYLNTLFPGISTTSTALPYAGIEFQDTLVIEYRRDGDTNDISCGAIYGILSKEFKREIILAGQPVPDRNGNPRPKTYPFDLMLVWFQGPYGISNKIEFPRTKALDLTAGILFETAGYDLTLNSPKHKWIQSSETKTITAMVGGAPTDIDIVNGIFENPLDYRLDGWEFRKRFGFVKQVAIESAKKTDDALSVFIGALSDAQKSNGYVDLLDPIMAQGVAYLESVGIIDAAQAATLLLPKSQWDKSMAI